MVMKDYSVKLLEVQWAPDSDQIMKVDDKFWDNTMRCMFLEEDKEVGWDVVV
jgi:hypothetical protein